MSFRSIIFGAGIALPITLGGSHAAFACACCSNSGQRLETAEPLSSGQREELSHLRFAQTATFYANEGFPDSVRGVTDPDTDGYRLKVEMLEQRLVFTLTGKKRQSGRIAFTLPARIERFEVDPRVRSEKSAGGGPGLYKEWRFNGDAALTGFVAGGDKRGRARLVLHGGGNSCTSAESFSHWTLIVEGPNTNFSLLGTLER